MKNYYLLAGFIVLISFLFFFFGKNKTEAPLEENKNVSTPSVLSDGSYTLIDSSSFITWEGEKITGMVEKGTVKPKEVSLKISGGKIENMEFIVDMNTIESNPENKRLVDHLKSEDFFAVNKYPETKFVLKGMEPLGTEGLSTGRYVMNGDLTVKGITKPVSFVATLSLLEDILSASASFAINRADWEIKYNSPTFFQNLGDKLIKDAIMIGLDLKAKKVIQ